MTEDGWQRIVSGFPFSAQPLIPVLGRAVIALTAVCGRARHEPVKVTDHCDIRLPTDVMAITSLPMPPANYPVSGFPLSDKYNWVRTQCCPYLLHRINSVLYSYLCPFLRSGPLGFWA